MTHFPQSPIYEQRKKVLRWVGIALSGLMVVTVVAILVFIVRSESAHDEATCPFTARSEQTLGAARVSEEARSCLPEVEEHRWLLHRAGKPAAELARKRLPKERFASGRAKWTLAQDDKGLVVLKLAVDGEPLSESHEADLPR